MKAIEVNFDPIKILTSRDLNLDITLVKPNLRLEQDAKGLWVTTEVEEEKEKGPVEVVLKTIRFQETCDRDQSGNDDQQRSGKIKCRI